jgi:hypothetical protein
LEVDLPNDPKYQNIFISEEHLPFLNKRKSNIQLIDELGQQNRNSMPNLISEINQTYLDKFKRKE